MWTPSSTRSPRRWRRNSGALIALTLALAAGCEPTSAAAQQVVFDPQNYVENALHAARQLQSLSNEALMLANQARQLAASPYSHLGETSQTLSDIGQLAQSLRGVASNVQQLEGQFDSFYPTAIHGLDPRQALLQNQARTDTARATAEDLARTAAELDRLSQGRQQRLAGAISASQTAQGQTAAIQSSTQVLAVLAEDLASLRTGMLAQSRLMAEETARRAAERAASADARQQFWGRPVGIVPPPIFDPYSPRD
ncbi:conjugal transfer protein TrbJ [Phenylobacterium sp.]|jgi:P-type conjugative transfer protein TrbJ|uniref:conjugal transfer protein TrbJ n=1 Tax=Phenylobacterium sp. TaxID=1871053 RepID=UPI002E2EA5CF|nr:conjugal transfer protein TrbJ [Phenylobacterium sp.]HEX4710627.1 conjugal transfer protein TrbJ [Phenylobacterium sp.]